MKRKIVPGKFSGLKNCRIFNVSDRLNTTIKDCKRRGNTAALSNLNTEYNNEIY
jgi:hypothetical protein